MFGRSKLDDELRASSSARRSTISSRVMASAVAVSAMRGTFGKRSCSTVSWMYSGRKSCPHCDTQCASSIANSADRRACEQDRGSAASAGAPARRTAGRARRRATRARSRRARRSRRRIQERGATPTSRSAATWSCISAISGETTMPAPKPPRVAPAPESGSTATCRRRSASAPAHRRRRRRARRFRPAARGTRRSRRSSLRISSERDIEERTWRRSVSGPILPTTAPLALALNVGD